MEAFYNLWAWHYGYTTALMLNSIEREVLKRQYLFENFKTRKVFYFSAFKFQEQLTFYSQLSWAWKSCVSSGPGILGLKG